MSEQKAERDPGKRRACFNCEAGAMARTTQPEPGWHCAACDTFLPDDQDKPRPIELEPVITQVIQFSDGSRLTVKVEAPPGERPPGLLAADLASRFYYAYLVRPLNLIEMLNREPGG